MSEAGVPPSDHQPKSARTPHFIGLLNDAEQRFIPLEVSIELTNRCNFRCRHCYINDHDVPDGLSTDRIDLLMKELALMGCMFLTFTGGEVFLRPDWRRLSRNARKLGFSLRIFTNASLVTDEIAAELHRLKIALEVSLYSMRTEIFDRITGHKGALEKTLRGIRTLVQADVEVKLKMPVIHDNFGCVEDVTRFAEEIGAELLSDPRIFHMRDGQKSSKRFELNRSELIEYLSSPALPGINPLQDVTAVSPNQPLCAAGTRIAHISALGEVRGCSFFPEAAGNIATQSFREIWQTAPQLAAIRRLRQSDLKQCDSCTRLSYCRRCYAQALVEDHDLLGPSRWACNYADIIENALLATCDSTASKIRGENTPTGTQVVHAHGCP